MEFKKIESNQKACFENANSYKVAIWVNAFPLFFKISALLHVFYMKTLKHAFKKHNPLQTFTLRLLHV